MSADDAAVSAAVHNRLRPWSSIAAEPVLRFEIRRDPQGPAFGRPDGPLRTVYDPEGGEVLYASSEDLLYIHYRGGVHALCDGRRGRAELAALDRRPESVWWLSHPLFTIPFVELLKRHGRYSLHASGVAAGERCVLFPGTSGAGKTTLSLALARSGFGFLGDDTVFLTRKAQEIRVLGFPDEVDVTDTTLAMFPELRPLEAAPKASGSHKRQIRPEAVHGIALAAACHPVALVFPRVADRVSSRLTPMARSDALVELAPNVFLTDAETSQSHLDALALLVRQTECYRLETGRDFDALAKIVGKLLA